MEWLKVKALSSSPSTTKKRKKLRITENLSIQRSLFERLVGNEMEIERGRPSYGNENRQGIRK
jgi:hypothetical protein